MEYGKDYYGFVYVWYNRAAMNIGATKKNRKRHPRLYVGSHLGSVHDGYICSSKWMKLNYKKCSSHFMRRIVYYQCSPDRKALLAVEQRWLNLIEFHELGARFYNLSRSAADGSWSRDPDKYAKRCAAIAAGNRGKKLTAEHRAAISKCQLGKKRGPHSAETRKKIADSLRGKKHTSQRRSNESASHSGKSWSAARWDAHRKIFDTPS